MAPGALIDEHPVPTGTIPAGKFNNNDAPTSLFPDGIRTSGQHAPLYDALKPYEDFPKEVSGATVWKKEDYENNPERWTHHFTEEEIQELGETADAFIRSDTPLTGIAKVIERPSELPFFFRSPCSKQWDGKMPMTYTNIAQQGNFPLPKLSQILSTLREDLLNGKGFILFKGFPTAAWGPHKTAVAYMGLGTYLGYFLSQNGRGHVLGHVKDVGDDPTQIDSVRIYRTAARQFFHTDDGDVVGLLCVHRAEEGGESDLVSAHNVWNTLQRERPDVAELLTRPIWYFDRKGEVSDGQEEWTRQPVAYLENGGKGRVYVKWDPYYVRSLGRFSDAGRVPPLSKEQTEALEVLESTANRLALHMILEVGDIQFVSNAHLLHARTAYKGKFGPRHLFSFFYPLTMVQMRS